MRYFLTISYVELKREGQLTYYFLYITVNYISSPDKSGTEKKAGNMTVIRNTKNTIIFNEYVEDLQICHWLLPYP